MPYITTTIEITSFPVPTGVTIKGKPGLRQDGFKPLREIPLNELDAETLNMLCNEFRRSVFEAAGKQRPEVKRDEDWAVPGSQEALNSR